VQFLHGDLPEHFLFCARHCAQATAERRGVLATGGSSPVEAMCCATSWWRDPATPRGMTDELDTASAVLKEEDPTALAMEPSCFPDAVAVVH